jgi:hypothetical protein
VLSPDNDDCGGLSWGGRAYDVKLRIREWILALEDVALELLLKRRVKGVEDIRRRGCDEIKRLGRAATPFVYAQATQDEERTRFAEHKNSA